MKKNLEKKIILFLVCSLVFFTVIYIPAPLIKIKIFFIVVNFLVLVITIFKPNYFSFLNRRWIKPGATLKFR